MSTRLTTHAPIARTPQQSPGLLLQRKCAGCGNHTGGSQCSGCAKKDQDKLQRRAAGVAMTTEIPPIVNDVLNSPGQPLDTATRAVMEPRFRHDFSQVRVHADVSAAESARAVNAHAFTVGSHIVFDASKYAPSTTAGKNLLAHELTHVLQQSHGLTRSATFGIGPANDEHEQQADAVAHAIVSTPGKPVVNNARPLIPGTQQTVARNDAPPPPPRTRLQRRTAEDELFDPFTGGESQAADGGGGDSATTTPEKATCPKVPTKRGDDIPNPMCPTATHTGLSEMDRFNFCLDSDELTDPSQLGAIPAAVARTRPSARFLIHGYASPEGNKDYNFRLACHRAIKIANAFRAALRTRLSNPLLTPEMLEAEVESRIETASQGPTSEFGKPEENRVAIVFEQVADKADPEPACKDAPRHIGDIKPEVGCDVPTRDLLHMDGSARLNQFHFCLDSDVLNGSDASDVKSFAHRQAASSTFVVHGFASVEGASDYNQRLSCHRALRIFRELINAGVKQEQIVEVSGLGETDHFGEPEFNRVVSVLAEGGDTGVPPPGTRKTDTRKQREAVRDEAVAQIMAGKYELAADAYISFWTCGRTATVRQAVERLTIEVQDDDKTEQVRKTMMGTEEGAGVNFIRLSNAALRADNSIECTMGRIIDSAFHHAAMTGDLPTTPVRDPNALPSDLTGPGSNARHQAGLHLIHLAGLSQCFGKNLEPHVNPAHINDVIGIDLPREDDPRKDVVPNCAEAPQPTRLHTPPEGAKDREAPGFEVVEGPKFTPNRGKLETNFDSEPEDPSTADQSKGDLITKPDKGMLTATATVQLKGQKDTFRDYEVGFIQAVIADEVQADYDSGHSVIQKLPTPIRLAEMKREPTVPAPWTSASAFARPDANGKVSLTASASGLNIEAAIGLRRINRQLPNSGLHSAEQGSRIAIWLIARRLGAPLDRFSVHFLDGAFYDLTQLVHLEHRRIKGELDQKEPKVLRERELPVFIGSFLSSKPSELPEDPSSARLTGPIASDIGLFNQVREVVEARASQPTDMDKTQLRAVVLDILDNLQVFEDAEKARAGKEGRRMPRLGFDFIPLTITMPFVRRTGRLVNPDKKELVIKVTGPGLGFDAGQAIAEALEFRIRDRVFDGKEVVLRQEFIPGKGETGDVSMTLDPIPRGRGADPKTDPDVTRNPEVLRSMAEAWACTLSTRGFLFQGVEFCRAFWMDREKQLRGVPEDQLVRGETKIENGGASVSECKLPCLAVEPGTTAGVRLVGFHTHPEPDPQPTEADLRHARDCEAPKNYIITDNQAFRFTQDGLVDDEEPIDLPKGVTCDPKNLEGFKQPPE